MSEAGCCGLHPTSREQKINKDTNRQVDKEIRKRVDEEVKEYGLPNAWRDLLLDEWFIGLESALTRVLVDILREKPRSQPGA